MENRELRDKIIESIERNIKEKKLKKITKAGIVSAITSMLIHITAFVVMLITSLSVLANLAPITMILTFGSIGATALSILEGNHLKRYDSYKKYCEEYEIIKNKKNKIYKVKTKNNKIIYLDKNEKTIFNCDLDYEKSQTLNSESLEPFPPQSQSTPEIIQPNVNYNKEISSANYILLNSQKQDFNAAIGREKELIRLQESLIMESTSPLIIGPPGVGKTALVKGLVYKIQKDEVPDILKGKKIGQVDVSDLVANTRFIGDFERKMQKFIDFAIKEDIVFFIDEFHTMIGSGQGSKSNLDGANILKPYLSNGEIKIIGATTEEEYENIIKTDAAFNRRFETIWLDEPDDKILCKIIDTYITKYENKYEVSFPKDKCRKAIIQLLVEMTSKKHRNYKNKINNPSLVISIIERCFVKAKMENSTEVTIKHICEAISNNENLYDSVIQNTIYKFNNLYDSDSREESFQKIIKFNQNK